MPYKAYMPNNQLYKKVNFELHKENFIFGAIMKAIGRRYIVELLEKETTKSGILISLKAKENQSLGKIVSAPSINPYGNVGDIALFSRQTSRPIEDKLYLIEEFDIVCTYNGEPTIENMTIPINYVLVDITADTTKVDVGGVELVLDTKFEKEYHAPTFGKVVKLPESLVCLAQDIHRDPDFEEKKKKAAYSLPWTTKCEILVEDTVHFDYLTVSVCEHHGHVHTEGDKSYFFVRYDQLYACENRGDLRLLNGYMAVRLEETEKVSENTQSGLVLVDLKPKDKRKKWGKGEIVYVGSPNGKYIDYPEIDECSIDVKIGDIIEFKDSKRSKFGQDMHIKNKELKGLYRVQRKDMFEKMIINAAIEALKLQDKQRKQNV